MMVNQLFYYTGSALFILLFLVTALIAYKLIVILTILQKTVKNTWRLIDETGTGIKIRLLEMLLKILGR
ncbi:MAG: hypothetical protein PHX72_00380 [Candidatus Shapirobacteria bacterium]|nr:hypothetical protein [Candidatus Shapirobacteria bacterium]